MSSIDQPETPSSAHTEKRAMGRAGLILSGGTLLSRILGLVRNQILSHFFGASIAADAFIAAFTIPNALRRLFAEGALTPAFVTLFTRELKDSPRQWRSFISSAFVWLGLITSVICLIGILFAPALVRLYVPEFQDTEGKLELTIQLTQILFPFLVLISWAALFMGVLNSLGSFAPSALGPAALNVTVILLAPFILYLYRDSPYQIHYYAGIILVGALAQLLIQLPSLKKRKALPNFNFQWKDPRVFELLQLLGPSVFSLAIYQLNIIINRIFASDIPGAVSHLYYADLLIELPVSLIATSLGVAAVPSFTRLFHAKDWDGLGEAFQFSTSLNMMLALPCMVGLGLLSQAFISSIFYTGAFSWTDVESSAQCLIYFSLGLPFFCLMRSLLPLYFAEKDTKTPAMVAFVALGVNLLAAISLTPRMGAAGIALATTLSSTTNFFILFLLAIRRYHFFRWNQMAWSLVKISLGTLLMGVLVKSLSWVLPAAIWTTHGITAAKLISCALMVMIAASFYLGFLYLLNVPEARVLITKALSRRRR